MNFVWIVVVSILVLAACSSPAVQYHTLTPAESPAAGQAAGEFAFAVLPVRIPPQVDVRELVLRENGSSLRVAENELWAAPLDEELRTALSKRLSNLLGVPDTYGLPAVESQKNRYAVQLKVTRFESRPGSRSLIDATWSVSLPEQAALLCGSSTSVPVQEGYSALVTGHQQAVREIAEQIANAIKTQRCPAAQP